MSKKNIDSICGEFIRKVNANPTQDNYFKYQKFVSSQMADVYNRYGSKKPVNISSKEFISKMNKKSLNNCVSIYTDKLKSRPISSPPMMPPQRPQHIMKPSQTTKQREGFNDGFAQFNPSITSGVISATGEVQPQMVFGNISTDDRKRDMSMSLDDRMRQLQEERGYIDAPTRPPEPNFRLDGTDSRADKSNGNDSNSMGSFTGLSSGPELIGSSLDASFTQPLFMGGGKMPQDYGRQGVQMPTQNQYALPNNHQTQGQISPEQFNLMMRILQQQGWSPPTQGQSMPQIQPTQPVQPPSISPNYNITGDLNSLMQRAEQERNQTIGPGHSTQPFDPSKPINIPNMLNMGGNIDQMLAYQQQMASSQPNFFFDLTQINTEIKKINSELEQIKIKPNYINPIALKYMNDEQLDIIKMKLKQQLFGHLFDDKLIDMVNNNRERSTNNISIGRNYKNELVDLIKQATNIHTQVSKTNKNEINTGIINQKSHNIAVAESESDDDIEQTNILTVDINNISTPLINSNETSTEADDLQNEYIDISIDSSENTTPDFYNEYTVNINNFVDIQKHANKTIKEIELVQYQLPYNRNSYIGDCTFIYSINYKENILQFKQGYYSFNMIKLFIEQNSPLKIDNEDKKTVISSDKPFELFTKNSISLLAYLGMTKSEYSGDKVYRSEDKFKLDNSHLINVYIDYLIENNPFIIDLVNGTNNIKRRKTADDFTLKDLSSMAIKIKECDGTKYNCTDKHILVIRFYIR